MGCQIVILPLPRAGTDDLAHLEHLLLAVSLGLPIRCLLSCPMKWGRRGRGGAFSPLPLHRDAAAAAAATA